MQTQDSPCEPGPKAAGHGGGEGACPSRLTGVQLSPIQARRRPSSLHTPLGTPSCVGNPSASSSVSQHSPRPLPPPCLRGVAAVSCAPGQYLRMPGGGGRQDGLSEEPPLCRDPRKGKPCKEGPPRSPQPLRLLFQCPGIEACRLEPQSLQRDTKAQRSAGTDPRSHSKSPTKMRRWRGCICPHRVEKNGRGGGEGRVTPVALGVGGPWLGQVCPPPPPRAAGLSLLVLSPWAL